MQPHRGDPWLKTHYDSYAYLGTAPNILFENGDWFFQGRFCCPSPMVSVIRAGNVRGRPYDIKLWVE